MKPTRASERARRRLAAVAFSAPKGAEDAYARGLRGIAKGVASAFQDFFRPRLADVARRADGFTPHDDALDELTTRIVRQIPEKVRPLFERMSNAVARRGAGEAKRLLHGDARAVVGITVPEAGVGVVVALAREENIRLVENAARVYARDVREVFGDPKNFGLTPKELQEKLLERGNVSANRAELIARDQTLKLNGAITKARQVAAGVRRYTWSTVGDERVRDDHKILEGEIFSWDAPPEPGHPGQDFQCRCVAIPVIEDEEETTVPEAPEPEPVAPPALVPEPVAPPAAPKVVARAGVKALDAVAKDDGAAARAWSRGVLARSGMVSQDTKQDLLGAHALSVRPLPGGSLGTHDTRTGKITIDPKVFEQSQTFLANVQAKKPVTWEQKQSIVTIIHEEVHGTSPAGPGSYKGFGIALEEASTELLARRAARESFGGDASSSGPWGVPTRASDLGARSYDAEIHELVGAVAEVKGISAEAARVALEDAAIAIRKGDTSVFYSAEEHAHALADVLKVDRAKFLQASIDADARAYARLRR